jgi:hypothetical protein
VSPPLTTLAGIVRVLGGDLYDRGRRALVPGPGHSRHDRSVSLLLDGGRVVAHSFAGDDWRAVLADLETRGLLAGDASGTATAPRPPAPERIAVARDLWAAGRAVGGTLGERHARRRGIVRDLPDALRFHPGVTAAVYADVGVRRPALLAAILDGEGELVGVELTYLAADGAAARVATPRKTVGARPRGSAVRLDPVAETILAAEGVFSALSAGQDQQLPAWALLAVANLAAWRPPAGVRRVVIAGDRGAAGEAGARRLALRLLAQGIAAELLWPPPPALDWNDAVRAAAAPLREV